MTKVVLRVKGGIGNQLFMYAAARRLALVNDAELVLDNRSGFSRDRFGRRYELDRFNIRVRLASKSERLEPLSGVRRALGRLVEHGRPLHRVRHVVQRGYGFDERMLSLAVSGTVFLEGYWQSEQYFKDVESTVRDDLRIEPPADESNRAMASKILAEPSSVGLHVRCFDEGDRSTPLNVAPDYYRRAIGRARDLIAAPVFYVFSDNPAVARGLVGGGDDYRFVMHNNSSEGAFADLWLMTLCSHVITANSTFSWWGAWLGERRGRVVITVDPKRYQCGNWGFSGLIPERWIRV